MDIKKELENNSKFKLSNETSIRYLNKIGDYFHLFSGKNNKKIISSNSGEILKPKEYKHLKILKR